MKHIIDALHAAARDTAASATADARAHVRKNGWSATAAKSVRVAYSDGEFSAELHGKHRDEAFVHEFGDETRPPLGTLRKYSRNTPAVEAELIKNLETHLKGLL